MGNIKKFGEMNENENNNKNNNNNSNGYVDNFLEENFKYKIFKTKRLSSVMGNLNGFDDMFNGFKRRGFNPYFLDKKEEILVPLKSSGDYRESRTYDQRLYFLNEEEYNILQQLYTSMKELKDVQREKIENYDQRMILIAQELSRRTKDGEPLKHNPTQDPTQKIEPIPDPYPYPNDEDISDQ